jgi:hypothetical protein
VRAAPSRAVPVAAVPAPTVPIAPSRAAEPGERALQRGDRGGRRGPGHAQDPSSVPSLLEA